MTLQISDLHPYQVIQRSSNNTARINCTIKSNEIGTLYCNISTAKRSLSGFKRKNLGRLSGSKRVTLRGIPCGGPYTITFELGKSKKVIKHILVGDLWVLGGQSNMEGIGVMRDALKPHPRVHMYSLRDQWKKAKDPINPCGNSLYRSHNGQDQFRSDEESKAIESAYVKGVGPGLAFARYLTENTGVPIGLIPCAKGGSSMQQWDPQLKHLGGDSLYGACALRINAVGGKVRGMIWSQGCSDADRTSAKLYTKRMKTLVAALRKEFGNMPWIMSQINGFYHTERYDIHGDAWTSIRTQQVALPNQIKKLACISTVDLDLDDGIHISAKGQHRCGERMAKVALNLAGYSKKKYTTPYIASISSKRGNQIAQTEFGTYALKIKGLNGKLISDGSHILGFSLRDKQGNKCRSIYKAWIHKDEIILQTELKAPELKKYKLYYGYGTTPLCNITDSEDMPLPACGPFDLKNV